MGNEANCQRFCDHKEDDKHEITSELKINDYPLECELCHEQVQHTNFKSHLDSRHFASVEETNQHITVVCLFCAHAALDLQKHATHLKQKHPYAHMYENQSPSQPKRQQYIRHQQQHVQVSNKTIKAKLQSIDSVSRLRVLQQLSPSQWVVQYMSQQYELLKVSKQYNGMEYDESQIYPELVLFPIFTQLKARARYFILEKHPLERTIQCNAYIICTRE